MSKMHTFKSKTRLYKIWTGMKNRCNPSNKYSTIHGKRGIYVCEEWKHDFTTFEKWAKGNGYKDNLSIDRIDNNGPYSSDNCRWTTQKIQSRNTRILYSHNKSGYRGVSWNKTYQKWEVSISVNNKTIKVGYYDDVKQAALAYNTYISDNNLEHTKNPIEGERVESNTGQLLTKANKSGYVGVSYIKRLAKTRKPWFTLIKIKRKELIFSCYAETALEAAKCRERFIIENKDKYKLHKFKLNNVEI